MKPSTESDIQVPFPTPVPQPPREQDNPTRNHHPILLLKKLIMSISKLAVELHLNAIERLDNRTLSSLSLVSKHWRNITEEYLYRDIKITNTGKLPSLLSTFLNRKDLTRYVRNFSCRTDNPSSTVLLYSVLPNQINEIRTTITQVTKSFPQHVSASWHESASLLNAGDGSIALILCLATNLEELDLNFGREDMARYIMTSLILKHDWKLSSSRKDTPPPLQSLKSFHVSFGNCALHNETDQMSIIPKSTSIRLISINRLEHDLRTYMYTGLGTMLHTFKISNAKVSLLNLSHLFQGQCFWHVKRLVITQFPYQDRVSRYRQSLSDSRYAIHWRYSPDNNIDDLMSAITKHLPDLEHLEISNFGYKRHINLFPMNRPSFGDHKNLVTLIIDYKLIARRFREDYVGFYKSHQSLPSNLHSLELRNIKSYSSVGGFMVVHLDNLFGLYRNYMEDRTPSTTVAWSLFGTKNLKELSLHIDLLTDGLTEDQATSLYSEETVHSRFRTISTTGDILISDFVQHLQKEGVETQVWRQECEHPRKLLYAPGYKSQQPIWSKSEVMKGVWEP